MATLRFPDLIARSTELGAQWTCLLPLPPSANAIWRSPGRGKVLKSKEYRAWITEAGWTIVASGGERIDGWVHVEMDVSLRRANADLDGPIKAVLDALQANGVIENDKLVRRLVVERMEDSASGFVAVRVSPWEHRP